MDDDAKKSLGQALIDAVQKGDPMGVYDAMEACTSACMSKDEPDEDDAGPAGKPDGIALVLGKAKR